MRRQVSRLQSAFFRKGWIGLSPRLKLRGPPGISSAVGPLDARGPSPLAGTTKRSLALKVALAALCISGWSAFGYGRWSFAATERDRLTQIAASEAEREQFRGELNELRHRTGDLRAVEDKLAAAREELRLSSAAREKALAQPSGQRELSVVRSDRGKETVAVTGGIRKIEPPTRAR